MGGGELEALYSQGLSGDQKRSGVCVGRGCGDCLYVDVETVGSDLDAGFSPYCRVMKLEASCGIATSEVLRAKKGPEPDAEPLSETRPQEARTMSKSGSALEG